MEATGITGQLGILLCSYKVKKCFSSSSWNHTSNDAYEMLKSNYILKSSASSSWKRQELFDNYARGNLCTWNSFLAFVKDISVEAPRNHTINHAYERRCI